MWARGEEGRDGNHWLPDNNNTTDRSIRMRIMIWFQGALSMAGHAIAYQHAAANVDTTTSSSSSSSSLPPLSVFWQHRVILLLANLLVAVVGWWQARHRPEVVLLHQGLFGANVLTWAAASLVRWDQADSQRSLDDLIAHQYRFKSL